MAIPAITTAALLSAPLVVLLVLFGHMATSAPTDVCLEGCVCYMDIQKLRTINCTSFKPVLTAASSLLSDFSHIDVLNIKNVEDGTNEYIFDGLFGVFSNIKYMNLINCSITKIYSSAFKGLKRLEELDLSNNKICKFSSETFVETPNLKVLDISNNPLRLSPSVFLYSRSLEALILSSCNLTNIPSGSFRGLPNLKSLDLYNNQIQSFTYRSFPRSLNHLWLNKNHLTNILTKAITSLNKLTTLDISENPINCTCSLIGLQDWFSSKGILFVNDVICYYPVRYRGKSWSKVSENDVCVDDTTIINENTEETSENSCEDEVCDENTIDSDRYNVYNAVQADQPTNEGTTEYIQKVVEGEVKENLTPVTVSSIDENDTGEKNININKIENLTENPLSAENITEINKLESETEINNLELESEKTENIFTETTTSQSPDSIKNMIQDETQKTEEITVPFKDKVESDIPTSTPSTEQGEVETTIVPITSVDHSKSLVRDDTTIPPSTQTFETTTTDINDKTENSDIFETTIKTETGSISLGEITTEGLKDYTLSLQTTTEEAQTVKANDEKTTIEDTESQTTTQLSSSAVFDSDEHQTTTSAPQTTTSAPQTTTSGLLITSTDSQTTTSGPQTTTSSTLLTSGKSLSDSNEETTTTTTESTTTIAANFDQGKTIDDNLAPSSSEVTTTASTPITTDAAVLLAHNEKSEESVETTTSQNIETSQTPTVPTTKATTTESINYVPQSKEDVPETTTNEIIKDIILEKELTSEPTNQTEAIFVLPSTNNREGKMLDAQNEEVLKEPKKSEAMGSYIVLGGIVIVLLLLILYASTKKGRQADRNKKPLNDPEGNMTELQDMTSLLPSSPVVNGHKNNKYPNEEPSVTAKLLDTDDQPDSNGNGYAFLQDNHTPIVKNETPEKIQKSNGNTTLPRTSNAGSSSGPPPLELTKARVVMLPVSIPRTPIYIQKNVDS